MARVFVSFTIEDRGLRSMFTGQKSNSGNTISFTDYSVKTPWTSSWKTECRKRIKQCKGVIGIVTKNTPKASGQLWELKCAYEEGIPVLLIHGHNDTTRRLSRMPSEIAGRRVVSWSHLNVQNFLNKVAWQCVGR